jgi:GntR family transcriptional regulator/MocR family aminotransferase
VQKLRAAGIDAAPLGRYTQRHRHQPGLVMGFAPFNEEEIDRAAQQVAAVLRAAA